MRRPLALLASVCVASVCVVAALAAAPAGAAERMAYKPGTLQKAEAEGKPIIVHVTATWCTTCAAQKPIVMQILKDPKYKNLVLIDADFDKEKGLLRKLGVKQQSTFIAYKGKQEVGRSTGDTDKASIESLFDKTS